MKVEIFEGQDYYRFSFNDYRPVVSFTLDQNESKVGEEILNSKFSGLNFKFHENTITISIPLEVASHILGLGEKAFGIDRIRKKLRMLNTDPGGYERGKDPIYIPIPFFIKVTGGKSLGVFLNFPGDSTFDLGVSQYDKILIDVSGESAELFIFKAQEIKEVLRAYSNLTGRTFVPPKWAIGHTISRYSYYPEKEALAVIDKYAKTAPVEAMYLDIDYMDHYRLFTWNRDYFSHNFIAEMHKRNVKVVTSVSPSVKADQNFELFRAGMGHYMEKKNGDVYIGNMWPGNSVFFDLLNHDAQEFWKSRISEWAKSGVDGVWLDMNEPTVLTVDHLFDGDALHRLDDGRTVEHRYVRNLYPYLQTKATFEGLSEHNDEPFILTRSGYAGIQKYAAVWTGDNMATWDDVKLQISMVTSLSVSGIPVVGCDIGGFLLDGSPDLLAAYYRMSLFFPIFRNHKDVRGKDQEVYLMPDYARNDILESIDIHYDFLDHILSLIRSSHLTGEPVVTPLAYEFSKDEDSFHVEDQYMVGSALLYAPQIYRGTETRRVYVPEGTWYNFWTNEKLVGPCYINSEDKYPLYQRDNSCVLYKGKLRLTGSGNSTLLLDEGEVNVTWNGKDVKLSPASARIEVETFTN